MIDTYIDFKIIEVLSFCCKSFLRENFINLALCPCPHDA